MIPLIESGKAILKKSNSHSVRVITTVLYESFTSMKWQTKKGRLVDERDLIIIIYLASSSISLSSSSSYHHHLFRYHHHHHLFRYHHHHLISMNIFIFLAIMRQHHYNHHHHHLHFLHLPSLSPIIITYELKYRSSSAVR